MRGCQVLTAYGTIYQQGNTCEKCITNKCNRTYKLLPALPAADAGRYNAADSDIGIISVQFTFEFLKFFSMASNWPCHYWFL